MVAVNNTCIHTIGHSNHSFDYFVNLLKLHSIDLIIDVRSVPYSRFAPQFNRKILERELTANAIRYEYMGDTLGGKNPEADLKDYRKGLESVMSMSNSGTRLAFMCAEKDPLSCHRFGLLSMLLNAMGINPVHILADGSIIGNEELLEKSVNGKKKTEYTQINLPT
jgi:uncharacterized protein (DUF488 family)